VIVFQGFTKIGNAPLEHVIGDKGVGPDLPNQLLASYHLARVGDEVQKHAHHLGFDVNR
jgi:hypothetical protein